MALLRNDSKFLDGKKIASENFVLDNINTHNNEENPHGVTKSHVGLSNVSNVLQASKEEFDSHINSSLHVSLSDRENWNNKQGSITAGKNITIFGNTISATNTTYDIADLLHDGLMSKEDKNKLVRSSNTLDYMQLEEGDYFNLDTLTSFMVTESEQHIPLVNTSTQGLMSGSDKIKLDGIAAGAQINPSIATKVEAETGTNNAKMMTALRVKEAINVHYNDKSNPHNVTKVQIGLSNVVDELQATKDEFDTHTFNSTHITSLERNTWNAKQNALGFTPENTSNKGKPDGYASLNSSGKIPAAELPSYVDDVIEGTALANLPTIGETGKIYVTTNDNKTYRWSGTDYTEISASLALGTTSSTAYRGDLGNVAYTHSQSSGNPHNTTKAHVGLGNVNNTSDANKPISTATESALNNKADKSQVLTNVPANAKFTDTIYTHPSSHPASMITETSTKRFVTDSEKANWNSKTDNTAVNAHIANKDNPHEVTKAQVGLANVDNVKQATKTEFDAHVGDSSHITTAERSTWNAKQNALTAGSNVSISGSTISAVDTTYDVATTSVDGLMSSIDKTKLNGIATGANNYTHPSSHPASIITETSTKRFVTDSEKSTWNAKADTLTATSTNDGLMASSDKTKLDGIQNGAQVNPSIASQLEALTGTDNTNMMTPLRTKEAILESATIVVNHGTNSSMARPYGAAVVYWVGTAEPANATNNDLWVGG